MKPLFSHCLVESGPHWGRDAPGGRVIKNSVAWRETPRVREVGAEAHGSEGRRGYARGLCVGEAAGTVSCDSAGLRELTGTRVAIWWLEVSVGR